MERNRGRGEKSELVSRSNGGSNDEPIFGASRNLNDGWPFGCTLSFQYCPCYFSCCCLWLQLLGMAGALETISGQSYGAQLYKELGTQTYTAIFSLTLFIIPLCVIWISMGKILVFIGQDPSIAHEAAKFMTYLVPSLFAYAVLQPLVRYFQSQSLVMPMLLSSCATLCLHIPLCWALVFKSGIQNLGGPIAICISMWFIATFLALYMMFSSSCCCSFSTLCRDFPWNWIVFPICFSFCCNGLLPNPELETSVLSVCLTTINALFAIPYGIGATASTRIANELGAENPQEARVAAHGGVTMGAANGLVISSILFATRKVFGYCFSSDKQVVNYVTTMAPLVCVNLIMDSIQLVLSGVARGCGWQHIGSFVNLAAFYGVGIPIAAALGFWAQMRGRGLWLRIMCGSLTQCVLLLIITSRTNWEEEARKARNNVMEDGSRNSTGAYADEQKPLIS